MLTACNSNDDNSSASATPTPTAKTISGTAAAGAPIIGQVTIKDANGVLKTVNLDINGKYSIDVTELTDPSFLERKARLVQGPFRYSPLQPVRILITRLTLPRLPT